MAPDRCRAYNDGLRKTAAEHRMRSYFDGGPGFAPYAPNYASLFSAGDGENTGRDHESFRGTLLELLQNPPE